jgi:hypothetical protein
MRLRIARCAYIGVGIGAKGKWRSVAPLAKLSEIEKKLPKSSKPFRILQYST